MRSDVPSVSLRDVSVERGIIGGPFGSSLGRKDYQADGVPVIRGANISQPPFVMDDLVFVSDEKADALSRCVAIPGDIVVTQRGTLGQVGRVPPGPYPRWLVSQSQMALRVSPEVADPAFVYYCLRSPQLQRQIHDAAIVTGVPHINLGIFGNLLVPMPTLREQARIAAVLGTLDDKIYSNTRMSETLIAIGAALVERSQWHASTPVLVGDVCEFHNKSRIPMSASQRALRPGSFPYYGATGVVDFVDDYLFSGEYVLVGEDGSVQTGDGYPVIQYVWGDFWVNNHAHVLTFGDVAPEIGYLVMRQANVAPFVTGAVQPKLSMRRLKEVSLRWPRDVPTLAAELRSIFAMFRDMTAETKTLTELRDALLPKLISGEIRMSA